jgi:pyruvate kinase
MDRRTKIVATIGPACESEEMIFSLLKSGVNIARLNFSHGTHEDHARVFSRIRTAARILKLPTCILLDLQGPKLRIGNVAGGGMHLAISHQVTLNAQIDSVEDGEIPVDFNDLPSSVHPGGRILLDDGNIELIVDGIEGHRVHAHVIIGGILKSHKGISLPDAHLDISAVTQKDCVDLEFGLKLGVDVIALSFVRSEKDIQQIRTKIKELAPHNDNIPVIAKLERPEAMDHLDEIMEAADGVMVARGDLGVEMTPQEVPIAQKRIIDCANRYAKVVITATQMLESMIHNPRPTRAEASDVANAIFDGTDAVMLSGETAMGDYPVAAVEMMDAIICQAEQHTDEWGRWHGLIDAGTQGDDTKFMSLAVRELAQDRNVSAIAVFTMSGRTALHVSKTRPVVPILAFTPDSRTFHRLEMYWGVTPILVPNSLTLEDMLNDVDQALKGSNIVKPGQQIALTCGFPVATISPTNLVLLHTIQA